MQEIIGLHDDILFDLEQIKLLSQKEVVLNRREEAALPKNKRKQAREEALAEKKARKKSKLRIWVLELEEKVKNSDLPPEIKSQILEITTYAKERDMTFAYNVEQKIERLSVQLEEAREKEERIRTEQRVENATLTAEILATTVLAATEYREAHPEFYHAVATPQEFERKKEEFYETKVLEGAITKLAQTLPPTPVYEKTNGSLYGKEHYALQEKHNREIEETYIKDRQVAQKAAGKPVQTADELRSEYERIPEGLKNIINKTLLAKHKEMKVQHEADDRECAAFEVVKGMLRQKRNATEALFREQVKSKTGVTAQLQEEKKRLGLLVGNMKKVLAQNGVTAAQILEKTKANGPVTLNGLYDTMAALNIDGFIKEVEASKREPKLQQILKQNSAPIKESKKKGTISLSKKAQEILVGKKEKSKKDPIQSVKMSRSAGKKGFKGKIVLPKVAKEILSKKSNVKAGISKRLERSEQVVKNEGRKIKTRMIENAEFLKRRGSREAA